MPQTKHEIQSALASAGMHPRHRFGQNFMIDQNLVRLVADAGEIQPGQTVIEVGPGTGTLTDELLSRGAKIIAVEIDRDLASLLREKYAAHSSLLAHQSSSPSFTLIEGDALAGKHAINPDLLTAIGQTSPPSSPTGHWPLATGNFPPKLIANLPYNIASPLVVELLLAGVELLAFTVQKEVADRLKAPAGGEAYGPLTVVVQMLSRVEVLRTLPAQAFWPAPTIASSLVRLRRDDRVGVRGREFGRFVHSLFAARRKTLRKALSMAGHDTGILNELGIDPQARPEVLEPPVIWYLFLRASEPKALPYPSGTPMLNKESKENKETKVDC